MQKMTHWGVHSAHLIRRAEQAMQNADAALEEACLAISHANEVLRYSNKTVADAIEREKQVLARVFGEDYA